LDSTNARRQNCQGDDLPMNKWNQSAKGRAYFRKWNRSPRGRAFYRKWNKSKKGLALHRKFDRSPKRQAWRKKWNQTAKGRANGLRKAAMRRAKIKKVTQGSKKLLAKIYARAVWWKTQGFDVAVDHIVPLIKGGAHSVKNLQIIYAFENRKKHASLTYKPICVFL
jgi:5-methylcytosine-specific restriction endonuclease McrA